MTSNQDESLQIHQTPRLQNATMVLAFDGWMDGGDVSTGTVSRLVDLLSAGPIAHIDPEPFYIYNFPGSMELASVFRPGVSITDGLIDSIDMPENTFYCHEPARLILFVGKEPNLRWRTFGDCVFRLAHLVGVRRILFVGSFGGAVPHTREPRLYITCSAETLLEEMGQFGVLRSRYEGPGSFTSYLMTRAPAEGLEMTSLVVEIPGYLQGTNPMSIEAVTRRLAKILQLPLDLGELRKTSTDWELEVSSAIEKNSSLAEKVRKLEEDYDNELLERGEG
jgi:proteasome assembly chaperone (PAC2) family protein